MTTTFTRRLPGSRGREVATVIAPFLGAILGDDLPFAIRFWDGSAIAPSGGGARATVVVRSPLALRRILYGPDELGFGRAYVAGELDFEGDLLWLLGTAELPALAESWGRPATWIAGARMATQLGILGKPLPPPPEEFAIPGPLETRLRQAQAILTRLSDTRAGGTRAGGTRASGTRASGGAARTGDPQVRDKASIEHHYDVGNDFYALVLGPTMAYSCARFVSPADSLEQAQEAKHDLICAKLGLQPGMRLLDVGCGWGGMVRHAAAHYGVHAVGITLSPAQQAWGAAATAEAGLADRVEIRLQDFRELAGDGGPGDGGTDPRDAGESFDAVCSIGMFEHVSSEAVQEYFRVLHTLLRPGGRLLNHAISQPQGTSYGHRSFLLRYVFPNGELRDVGATVQAMQLAGFEARDVESLREHYALTLRRWLENLERHWEAAQAMVGPARARIWRLYMTASVNSFERGDVGVHQVLGVKPVGGRSLMPLTRAAWA
ncbi:MAG: class I SAM-dependent methyltransferase [Acidimicrobiales bacterium]